MTVGERMLWENLAAQNTFKAKWQDRYGRKVVAGVVAIFIFRAAVEILVQNFLHKL